MKKYLVIVFFLMGVLFRLWLVGLVPQPFVFDQEEYHRVALDILGDKRYMHISSYRMSGYPVLLSVIYHFFGPENSLAWKTVQAFLDTFCALFIFLIAKIIFKKKSLAFVVYVLYLFNPYTSAYVGVRLTEVATGFFLTLTLFLFLLILKEKKLKLLPLFLLGVTLGYLPQVRPGFLFFSLLLLGLFILRVSKANRELNLKIVTLFLFLTFFLSPFAYNLAKNYVYFHELSPTTVDNLFLREFYVSLFIENFDTIPFIPKEVNWLYQEYQTAKNKKERRAIEKKYLNLTFSEIKKDPVKFILGRFKKLWHVWEKHVLFPYDNPKNTLLSLFVYWGNTALLAFSFFGLAHWTRGVLLLQGEEYRKWFAFLVIFVFLYISILHAFTITAERFSLPAYPLIFLFVGYSFSLLKWRII